MRLWAVICFLAIMAVLPCANGQLTTHTSRAARRAAGAKKLAAGDYLRFDYIQNLSRTHSPLAAWKSGTAQLIQARMNQHDLLLSTVLNFHEGVAEFVVHADGSAETKGGAGYETSNLVIRISDAHHVTVGFDAFKPMPYVFVGDAERYVRTKALSGRYADKKGRSYIFGANGWAIFPGERFEYRVGLDHIPNEYDYFDDKTSGRTYAFKRHGKVIEIFRTSGEINQNVDETPILRLEQTLEN